MMRSFYEYVARRGAARAGQAGKQHIRPLAEWIAHSLRRPPVAGDSVPLGSATLVVRGVREGRICAVGLGLPE
jgi:NhaP-type Na+/H+ and K+/H+ antiporter